MTESEKEELRLMQKIYDEYPEVIDDLFHISASASLGKRFNELRQTELLEFMEQASKDLGASIAKAIDADIIAQIAATMTVPPDMLKSKNDPFNIEVEKDAEFGDNEIQLLGTPLWQSKKSVLHKIDELISTHSKLDQTFVQQK